MALTSPDNIFSPDRSKIYALTDDLSQLTGTVQSALTRRANQYIGTSAEREASSNIPNGVHWQDTDGAQLEHVKLLDSWVPVGGRFYAGTSAQRSTFTNAPEGSHWQDTSGSRLEYVRDSGEWKEITPILSGVGSVTTGTVPEIGSSKIYGKTVSLNIPVRVNTSTHSVHLTPIDVGNGYGFISISSITPSTSTTKLNIRFTQVYSSASQNLKLLWSVVPLTN